MTVQKEHYAFVSDDIASQGKAAVIDRLKQLHEAGLTFVLNGNEEADGVWEEAEEDHPHQNTAISVLQGTWDDIKAKQLNC